MDIEREMSIFIAEGVVWGGGGKTVTACANKTC